MGTGAVIEAGEATAPRLKHRRIEEHLVIGRQAAGLHKRAPDFF
jgi:hypothetical protein